MKVTSDEAKAAVYIVGGALVLYAIYTIFQVSKKAASDVAATANRVASGVSNFVADTTQPVRDAFAETLNFRTYPQTYGPADTLGSMSRQDALVEMNAIQYQVTSQAISDTTVTARRDPVYIDTNPMGDVSP